MKQLAQNRDSLEYLHIRDGKDFSEKALKYIAQYMISLKTLELLNIGIGRNGVEHLSH